MRFPQVMLIVPAEYKGVREFHTRPPVGIGYIAEALHQIGIDYVIIDMGLGYDVDYVLSKIKELEPNLVCMTAMTFGYNFVYGLIAKIKEMAPQTKTIIGGSLPWSMKEKTMEDCPGLDFSIPSEGEEVIQEICLGKVVEEIKGLYYRENGVIKFTGDREFFNKYPTFPFPKYHNFELDKYGKYRKEITLQSSRGCPYKCTYCGSGAAF